MTKSTLDDIIDKNSKEDKIINKLHNYIPVLKDAQKKNSDRAKIRSVNRVRKNNSRRSFFIYRSLFY